MLRSLHWHVKGEESSWCEAEMAVGNRWFRRGRRRRLGPYSVQSVAAAQAVSLAIGHNPGRVATPTQDTRNLVLILPTSEGWQAESTPPGINSTADPKDPKPTTWNIKPTQEVEKTPVEWNDGLHDFADDWEQADWSEVARICFINFFYAER